MAVAHLAPAGLPSAVQVLRRSTKSSRRAQAPSRLGVHPQTVRHRIRLLDRVFGNQLIDPEQRFATEAPTPAPHPSRRQPPCDTGPTQCGPGCERPTT
jgi:hypothetical protein